MNLRLLMLTWCCVACITSQAQNIVNSYPKVGEPIKDHIFTDVANYTKPSLKISDFRGQWLVVDFWSRYCGGCIASFPKMNHLNEVFKGKVKVLMVALYKNDITNRNSETYTKKIFATKRRLYELKFTNAFDSLAKDKFHIGGIPAIFVINPEGTIVAKTTGLDSGKLADLIAGRKVDLNPSYSNDEPFPERFNYDLPFLANGRVANGGIDTSFIGRTVFARWGKEMTQAIMLGFDNNIQSKTIRALGFDLTSLYRLAYVGNPMWLHGDSLYGKFSTKIVINVKDSSLFHFENGDDRNSKLFGYERVFPYPIKNAQIARKYMLEDINSYLNFNSEVQERDVEVYKLVVTNLKLAQKLRSKGGIRKSVPYKDKPGIELHNVSFKEFIPLTVIHASYFNLYKNMDNLPVLIDETGIDFNIDFDFDADSKDWIETTTILRKNGLGLVKGTLRMNCIVITDKK